MKTIEGYDIKIFTDNIEQEALDQINGLLKVGVFDGCKIRIMPDVHSGAGCVIGFTSEMKDKVISNIVGVDLGCLDKDTEILTETGWIKISDYIDQKILVYDRFKEVAKFEKPLAYIKAPCNEFYYFKNSKGLDQMLSEEHTMLLTLGNPKKHAKLKSKSLYNSEELQNPGFFCTKTDKQLIKGYYGFYSAFNIDNLGISLSDDLIRVDIMIQADGHVELHKDLSGTGKHYSYEMHFKKGRKIDRCKDLLNKAKIKFKEHVNPTDKSTTISFQLPESIGINKDITKYYLANKHQLEIVADECLYWDGSKGYRSYYSNTKKDAVDIIQFAFSAIGTRAGICTNIPKIAHHSIAYQVIPTKNPIVGYTCRPTIVKSEDGFKYCFTTNTGFFVARRNNNIFITGNCGMLVHKLSSQPDSRRLQDTIEAYIPYGHEVRKDWIHIKPAYQKYRRKASELIEDLKCKKELRNIGRLADSVGSLGGGNHFIEIDKDKNDNYYLVIHSGSRNLGKQVAEYYQDLAIKTLAGNTKESLKAAEKELTKSLKEAGRRKEISGALRKLKEEFEKRNPTIPKDLCWLEGKNMEDYLHDVKVCQEFAHLNRELMALIILDKLSLESVESFETIHNYIDLKARIIRKGAVSAKEGEKLIIPMNMRDGSLICIGKGNPDWNWSAPHGAGRIMSRAKAKQTLDLDVVKESMKGINTWSLNMRTIDEAPQAYKPMQEIIDNIQDTVEIIDIIKPIYNFKADE